MCNIIIILLSSASSSLGIFPGETNHIIQATNFHEFYKERKNPASNPMAQNALYNMKVLNRKGSMSEQEWEVSRMYIAVKFRKVPESTLDLGDDDVGEDEMKE